MSRCGCGGGGSTASCGYNNVSGCDFLLSTICVVYQGIDPLDMIGGKNGTRLENILVNINSVLKKIQSQIIEGFLGANIGGGAEVYKGLNTSDVGEIRTLIGSDSIKVEQLADTIQFSIKQAFLDNLTTDIKADIAVLKEKVASLEAVSTIMQNDIAALKLKDIDIARDITTLKGDVSNLTQLYTELHGEVSILNGQVTTLIGKVGAIEVNVANLLEIVEQLKNRKVLSMKTEYFGGQQIMLLSEIVEEIHFVSYNGLILKQTQWLFEAPNKVAIQLTNEQLPVTVDDCVVVHYSYVSDGCDC